MAKKKSRQTFEKMKREQAVKERRARKQERKEAARVAKASVDSATDPSTVREPIVKRHERKVARMHRGTLAVSAEPDGYGFIEPAAGGGQLLVRQDSIEAGELRVGDVVQYAVSSGSFAVEAVSVRPGQDPDRRP